MRKRVEASEANWREVLRKEMETTRESCYSSQGENCFVVRMLFAITQNKYQDNAIYFWQLMTIGHLGSHLFPNGNSYFPRLNKTKETNLWGTVKAWVEFLFFYCFREGERTPQGRWEDTLIWNRGRTKRRMEHVCMYNYMWRGIKSSGWELKETSG